MSELIRDTFEDVEYAVLTSDGSHLPLILVLHGANSSREVLAALQPLVDSMSLPPSVLACASTPTVGGFYLGRWEAFVGTTFPGFMAKRYGTDLARVSLMGSSMGGYGALKLAFVEPARFQAVAAVAPALLPALARRYGRSDDA
jgi:S-formylglutathione hydrolase